MLAGLTRRLGKHTAQRLMHDVLAPGARDVHDVSRRVGRRRCRHRAGRQAWTTWGSAMPAGWSMTSSPALATCAVGGAGRMDMSLPRARLALLPTPLVRAPRLERALDAGPIFLKRDDLTGFGIAGNKARTLEFLIGAAVAERPTSSSRPAALRRTSARPRRWLHVSSGMDCDLLFPGEAPAVPSPNVELARAAGARLLLRRRRDPRPARRRCRSSTRRAFAHRDGDPTRCRAAGRPQPAGSATPMRRESWPSSATGRSHCPDGRGGHRLRRHAGRAGRRTGRRSACRGGSSAPA